MMAYVVDPLFVFLAVWGTVTALYAGGVWAEMFPQPQQLTIEMLLLNLGTFSLGYLTWSLFQALPPRLGPTGLLTVCPGADASRPPVGGRQLTKKHLVRALQITLLVGVAALGVELYRLTLLARQFNTSGSYLVMHPSVLRLRLVQFIGANVFRTSGTVMLLSLTNGIFSLGFVLLGLFLYWDRTWRRYVYLSGFLAISLLIGLLHLSRYEMTANILFLVFAYCFMSAQDGGKPAVSRGKPVRLPPHFNVLVPLAVIGVLFLVIDLLLRKSAEYGQTSRLQGFAFHFWWYLASPPAAFNEFLTTFPGDYGWGRNTFFPLYKWLCRLDLAPEFEVALYDDKILIPYMTNVYTYLRSFYEDFGLWGVTLGPYLLGGSLAVVRQRARRSLPFLNLYLVLLVFVLFSFYNFFLFSSQIYLQVLFGFVFFRYELGTPLGSVRSVPGCVQSVLRGRTHD